MNQEVAVKDSDYLPLWDLSDFYHGFDDKRLDKDIEWVYSQAQALESSYKGQVASLSGDELAELIILKEELDERIGRIISFAHLSYVVALDDVVLGQQFQSLRERLQESENKVLFIFLDLQKLTSDEIEDKLKSSQKLSAWGGWLRDLREWQEHLLSDELEEYIAENSVVGKEAWQRLFDETMARLTCNVEGEQKTLTETLHQLTDKSEDKRKSASQGLNEALKSNSHLLTHITNTLAKIKSLQDKRRGFTRVDESRHKRNLVETEIVDVCVSCVREHYKDLSHRYYGMKANWMGKTRLEVWDRLAPPPGDSNPRYINWQDATNEVLMGFQEFSPKLAEIGRKFFNKDNSWIDARPRPGKDSGAFSAATVVSVHPYIMMNYKGKKRDVMTLAHELGHGIHQWLASNKQGYYRSATPLTLAETASVFGEMLVFRRLLKNTNNDSEKFFLLASKIEDMLATVVRQISFYDFEYRIHETRQKKPLTTEEINEIWCEVSRESLGPSVNIVAENYGYNWSYIPHFIHTPFYVYSYAFGDCLANGLYQRYIDGMKDFVEKYEELLAYGGSKRHYELLKPFGIDIRHRSFWEDSLRVIHDMIEELATLRFDFSGDEHG